MLVEQEVLNDLAPNISATDMITLLHGRGNVPLLFSQLKAGNEMPQGMQMLRVLSAILFKGLLDTIVDRLH